MNGDGVETFGVAPSDPAVNDVDGFDDADADPLGAMGGGTRLTEGSYGGSDNPFAGAHDGNEVRASRRYPSILLLCPMSAFGSLWGGWDGSCLGCVGLGHLGEDVKPAVPFGEWRGCPSG